MDVNGESLVKKENNIACIKRYLFMIVCNSAARGRI